MIIVNGKVIQGDCSSVNISANRIIINGVEIGETDPNEKVINIVVEGNVGSISMENNASNKLRVDVTVNGNVDGNIDATTINRCGDVKGDIDGTTVNCKDVAGDVDGTTINCGSVGGNVDGTTINCGSVQGKVKGVRVNER